MCFWTYCNQITRKYFIIYTPSDKFYLFKFAGWFFSKFLSCATVTIQVRTFTSLLKYSFISSLLFLKCFISSIYVVPTLTKYTIHKLAL